MTRPAWGASAADRIVTSSGRRDSHSNRRTLTEGEGFINSTVRSALPAREFTPRGDSSSLVGDHRETQSILLVMPGLRDHAPRFLWSETLVESRTSRTLCRSPGAAGEVLKDPSSNPPTKCSQFLRTDPGHAHSYQSSPVSRSSAVPPFVAAGHPAHHRFTPIIAAVLSDAIALIPLPPRSSSAPTPHSLLSVCPCSTFPISPLPLEHAPARRHVPTSPRSLLTPSAHRGRSPGTEVLAGNQRAPPRPIGDGPAHDRAVPRVRKSHLLYTSMASRPPLPRRGL